MGLTNIEITLDDRDWPKMRLTVKAGQRVQKEEALWDVANSKFAPVINNFVGQAVEAQIQRRRAGVKQP